MHFEIRSARSFTAAHQLRMYDASLEPLHEHNWQLEVTIEAPKLDSIGVVMDFHELERLVDQVVGPMHNTHLNELPAFADINPSAENVALHIARSLRLPAAVRLTRVEVWETQENSAAWCGDRADAR